MSKKQQKVKEHLRRIAIDNLSKGPDWNGLDNNTQESFIYIYSAAYLEGYHAPPDDQLDS